jgi:uncharacterized membrane protein
MGAFTLALAGFVLIHLGVAATAARAAMVRRIGEGPYRALFALASLALLAWLAAAFAAMRRDPFDPLNELVWRPPEWTHWLAAVLVSLGIMLAVAGALTPGPPFVGFGKRLLPREESARGVLRITRHPALWGVVLWGAGHAVANGERFAIMLFGALTFMAIYGARSIDRKARARDAEGWSAFEAATSNLPFLAIAQGRNRLALGEMWWRLLAGLAVALLVALAHDSLFGAPALTWP